MSEIRDDLLAATATLGGAYLGRRAARSAAQRAADAEKTWRANAAEATGDQYVNDWRNHRMARGRARVARAAPLVGAATGLTGAIAFNRSRQ